MSNQPIRGFQLSNSMTSRRRYGLSSRCVPATLCFTQARSTPLWARTVPANPPWSRSSRVSTIATRGPSNWKANPSISSRPPSPSGWHRGHLSGTHAVPGPHGENVFMGRQPVGRFGRINRKAMRTEVKGLMARLGEKSIPIGPPRDCRSPTSRSSRLPKPSRWTPRF